MAALFFPIKRAAAGMTMVCLLAALLFYTFGLKQTALVFDSGEEPLVYLPLTEGEEFSLLYTHSIHLSEVQERYLAEKDGTITLFELIYEDFGIGMPSEAMAGETFTMEGGKYIMSGMDRNMPFFYLRTGQVKADHTITYGGHARKLSDVIVPGSRVKIGMEKLTKWQFWRGVNLIEEGR